MSKLRVEYLGDKPVKQDNVAGTGTVWIGKGDVQDVPAPAWPHLSKHPTVWRLAADVQTKTYADGTQVTGLPPLPPASPLATPVPAPIDPQTAGAVDLAPHDVLLGSSVHLALIDIGSEQVQLGEIVAGAHKESGLSAAEWNALPEADRHDFIDAQIEVLKLQAAKQAERAAASEAPVAKKRGKK